MSDRYLNTELIWFAESVTAGANTSSDAIDLNKYRPEGYFSLQVTVSGSGTAKFEYLLSNNGSDYLEPLTGADITASHTATSGPGSDGKDIYYFDPEPARYLKIKVTETGGANSITVTATLVIQ